MFRWRGTAVGEPFFFFFFLGSRYQGGTYKFGDYLTTWVLPHSFVVKGSYDYKLKFESIDEFVRGLDLGSTCWGSRILYDFWQISDTFELIP